MGDRRNVIRSTFGAGFLVVALTFALGCQSSPTPDPDDPGPLGEFVKNALTDLGHVPTGEDLLEYRIFQLDNTELAGEVTLESCGAVNLALADVCADMQSAGEAEYCQYQASFFYAHEVPRCAVRFEIFPAGNDSPLRPIHVLDFAGTPLTGPAPTCGNGVLDEGEDCDDGNFELWDGCDSSCNQEPFNGCEAVIENLYSAAGIAQVSQDDWAGPRSHLMVNNKATSMRAMNENTCNAAIATATDVCNELSQAMPFVGYCWAGGQYHVEESGPECSIRLNVWFQQLDSDFGVYTTGLPGILAFTIR